MAKSMVLDGEFWLQRQKEDWAMVDYLSALGCASVRIACEPVIHYQFLAVGRVGRIAYRLRSLCGRRWVRSVLTELVLSFWPHFCERYAIFDVPWYRRP